MKNNNVFFKSKVYSCDLKDHTMLELFSTKNNSNMVYYDFGVYHIISDHSIVIYRDTTRKSVTAHISLLYSDANKELTLAAKPHQNAYMYPIAGLIILGCMVNEGSYSLENYIVPPSFVFFVSILIMHSIYVDFKDIKVVVEDTLQKYKLQ